MCSTSTTVLPVSTYVAVTAPLGEKLFEAVRYTGAVADTRRTGDYYRIVADDRLLWGGRITTDHVVIGTEPRSRWYRNPLVWMGTAFGLLVGFGLGRI